MQRLPLKQKVARCLPYLQRAGLIADPPPCDTGPYLAQILVGAGDRVKMSGDVLDYDDFFVADDGLEYDRQGFEKRIANAAGARELVASYASELTNVEPFDAPTLEAHLKDFVQRHSVKIGDVVHAVRVAVTGKGVGFGLFDALAILGRDRCQRRIARALTL